jgi:hypothetical protein
MAHHGVGLDLYGFEDHPDRFIPLGALNVCLQLGLIKRIMEDRPCPLQEKFRRVDPTDQPRKIIPVKRS